MAEHPQKFSRRGFLASAAGATIAGGVVRAEAVPPSRAPIAAIGAVYRPLSCLYHLAGRYIHGWPEAGQTRFPRQAITRLWVDQTPDNDLSAEVARRYGIRRTRTVHDAIVEGGRFKVEGVLLAAEHGNYARNELGQILYPRFELFTQIVAAFHEAGSGLPVYVARQLSHDFAKARQMVAWSRQLGFPLAAGSAVPFASRGPQLDARPGEPLAEVVVAGFGPVEVGAFDAIETLLALSERRAGGETGVAAVTCLTGSDVWRAGDAGRWSWPLLEAALERSPTANLGDVRRNAGSMAVGGMPATPAIAVLIEFQDGLRGAALLLNGHVADFTAALRDAGGQTRAGAIDVGPPPGARHHDRLVAALEPFFADGVPPAPVERTLLSTGILAVAMASRAAGGTRIETPELAIEYAPAS